MTGRVKTRLEPGGGVVEDWRSGGRMTSDDSGRLDGWSAVPGHLSPGGWRAEPRRLERPRGQAVGRDAESQSRRDERKRRLMTRCLEAKAMADRWGVGEMGVPTATNGRRRGDVADGSGTGQQDPLKCGSVGSWTGLVSRWNVYRVPYRLVYRAQDRVRPSPPIGPPTA
ncbi:hypothetical protein HAX54_040236 [Datura stramonium]|uniref:Uncharacterized protein n=1 Tax=Datura stramonium TaxID=4076 RepID=A0ABS8SK98_DATST|nr:hypothetical protein [Datura stramonium]